MTGSGPPNRDENGEAPVPGIPDGTHWWSRTLAMLAIDIVGFGDHKRDDRIREHLHLRMHDLLRSALACTGIDTTACRFEDRGDGVLALLPSADALSEILEPLIEALHRELINHNHASRPEAEIRLRLAAHVGAVIHDPQGLVGSDVNYVFRLLDSGPAREAMKPPTTVLGIIISAQARELAERADITDSGAYRPVRFRAKETEGIAWLRTLADLGPPPSPPEPAEADRPVPLLDVAHFTGRGEFFEKLDALADDLSSPTVAVLVGMPGVGKTAIATTWAHRNAHRFPDGLITIDLHPRASEGALGADDALAQLLRYAGVAASSVPVDAGERAQMWHNLTRHQRLLVILDAATDSAQVRPLLPHGSRCLTLVTSQSDLETLVAIEGARSLTVPLLPVEDAVHLVRAVVGDDRTDDESGALDELVKLCGRLPLALRLAAAKLAVHPHWTVSRLAGELAAHPLAALKSADDPAVTVSAAFDVAYRGLSPTAQRTFRLLGLVPGPHFHASVVAPLLGAPIDAVSNELATLERLHLLEPSTDDSYRFHDLLAAFARDRLASEERPEDRDAALRALLDAYLAAAQEHRRQIGRRSRRLRKETASVANPRVRQQALQWFATEWENLTAAATAALDADMPEMAIDLADALFDMLDLSGHARRNVDVQRTATRAAESIEDWPAMALSLVRLTHAQRLCGDGVAASDTAAQARELAAQVGDPRLESDACRVLGLVQWRLGHHTAALESAAKALDLARGWGDAKAEASALNLLAQIKRHRGAYESARADAATALGIWRRLRDRENGAVALDNIARVLRRLPGRAVEAIAPQRQALHIFREYGDEHGHASACDGMARILRRAGRYDEARHYAAEALRLRKTIADERGVAETLDTLARLHHDIAAATGSAAELERARKFAEDGIARARAINDQVGEAAGLSNYAKILLALGELDAAEVMAEQAVGIGEDLEDPFGQAQRLENSAAVLRALNRTTMAEARDKLARELRAATIGEANPAGSGHAARQAPGQAS